MIHQIIPVHIITLVFYSIFDVKPVFFQHIHDFLREGLLGLADSVFLPVLI